MADPPGYFVGRPLHLQEQPQQAATPPPRQVAAPAVGDQNSVAAQVPGYYSAPVSASNGSAAQGNPSPGFLARLLGCFSSGGSAS